MTQKLQQQRCPISTTYFMSEILENINKDYKDNKSKKINENRKVRFEGVHLFMF